MTIVIAVENLSKAYRLGQISTGTLTNDLKVWYAKARGKPNPLLKIGQADYGNRNGETIWALRDVNFTVEQGEVLGIIGRNGAGKSTLLKILSSVTAPTSGQVKMKGRVASLLEVGTGFNPELTGRENIYLNGAILGMKKAEIERKFNEIIAFAEIEKFMDTPVKRYSSGMYVRLAFAVAAHLEPEILLVDEVLAVGDAAFQKKCLGKIGDVAKEGRTVLFVSHNMGAMQNLCSRAFLIDQGQLVLSGETRKVVSSYLANNYQRDGDPFSKCSRSGNGKIRITSFHTESADGQILANAVSGEPIVLVIGFENSDENLSKVSVGFSIHTENEFGLLLYYSHFSNVLFSNLPRRGQFRCLVDKCPLAPGSYLVMLRVIAGGDEVDWPKVYIPISVLMGDFYSVGSFDSNLSTWGSILVKGDWSIQPRGFTQNVKG